VNCLRHLTYFVSNVNVNVNLYSALSHSASNVLNAPNTAETNASSIGHRSWRCRVLDHAGRWPVHSRCSDQSRRTHNCRTYQAVFLACRRFAPLKNFGVAPCVHEVAEPAVTFELQNTQNWGTGPEETNAPAADCRSGPIILHHSDHWSRIFSLEFDCRQLFLWWQVHDIDTQVQESWAPFDPRLTPRPVPFPTRICNKTGLCVQYVTTFVHQTMPTCKYDRWQRYYWGYSSTEVKWEAAYVTFSFVSSILRVIGTSSADGSHLLSCSSTDNASSTDWLTLAVSLCGFSISSATDFFMLLA